MIRLKKKYEGKSALIIFGGPSIVENGLALESIPRDKYVIFLESKSLTPYFLKSGLKPDYFLLFYLEKGKSNSFQHIIFQSFLADIDLTDLIKDDFFPEYRYIKENFNCFFEPWRPERGPHKKYRYKKEIFFKNSPIDLFSRLKDTQVIINEDNFNIYGKSFSYPNTIYKFRETMTKDSFKVEDYFNPDDKDGILMIKDYSFINSSAIALFPNLNYMGFKKIYFLGMDMSMLGSMEYASCYTFKDMQHYGIFFKKAKQVFNARFKPNIRKFMRPPYEFKSLNQILEYKGIEFINIFSPFRYAMPVKGIKNISFEEFLNE